MKKFSDLVGVTLKAVNEHKIDAGDELHFILQDGSKAILYHSQDCCESVSIEDINGDLGDLIDSPILRAEESSNCEGREHFDTRTWTFYIISTIKGTVTIRWIGESNGYYSESVDFRYQRAHA